MRRAISLSPANTWASTPIGSGPVYYAGAGPRPGAPSGKVLRAAGPSEAEVREERDGAHALDAGRHAEEGRVEDAAEAHEVGVVGEVSRVEPDRDVEAIGIGRHGPGRDLPVVDRDPDPTRH